jgi:predicted P-loop ATPase
MEELKKLAKHVKESHFLEWKNSSVSQDIIELNIKSLDGNNVYEYLCYGIPREERRNDGRLLDRHLNRYKQASEGGWYCAGIDLITLKDSNWGCFKPDKFRKSDGKIIKYEHPSSVPTELFVLKVPDNYWRDAIETYQIPKRKEESFWEWVLNNPLPVLITEGAKKAGCLLTTGYIAVALPGVFNSFRDDELHPQLKALCKVPREFVFCFDQDTKWQTRIHITQAIKKTGKALEDLNSDVFVMVWDGREGKGIDDFVIKNPGLDKLNEIYDGRLDLEKYLETNKQVRKLDKPGFLDFLEKSDYIKRLEFNLLTSRVELDGKPIELDAKLCYKMIKTHMINVSVEDLIYGFLFVADENSYHPAARYFKSCKDLEDICIDDLANRYLGIDPNDFHSNLYNIFVRKFFISAIARVFEPGCEVHQALLLQGQEGGSGKSTFFKTMGGKWYDCSATSDIDSTKNKMVFHKCLIQEWDEFEKITSAKAAGNIKSFITNPTDSYVKPYGRDAIDHPRQFVICGTVNKMTFLQDETGNRRFPVIPIPPLHKIPNDRLALERDRLWGAFYRAYLKGKEQGINAWVFTPEEERITTEVNHQFMEVDVWQEEIETFLADRPDIKMVTIAHLMEKLFHLELKEQEQKIQKRIARILTMLGWTYLGKRETHPETGERGRFWRRPELPVST